jgi:carboxymethylenebutenolidase
MCHGNGVAIFGTVVEGDPFADGDIRGLIFNGGAKATIAILPDIYGCTPFYRGLANYLARKHEAKVLLLNPFHAFGDLAEPTRDAAFQRRHKMRDMQFMNSLEMFIAKHNVSGLIGFCLGGLYVFELVRRNIKLALVALYPFPQGLPNQDPLPVPLTYLDRATTSHTVLIGDRDTGLGDIVTQQMRDVAANNPAIDLEVYPGSGHGFLADLDSDNPDLRNNAEAALARAETAIFG